MNGTVLKQVHTFNYLGSLITSDGRCINEIKGRMAQAKAYFHNMKSILTNKRMSLGVRKRVLQCYIEPILLYGCESWSMIVNDKTNINAHRSNGNVVLEKNAQSIVDRKENQFRNSKYSKKYKKAYKQRQEKTSRISRQEEDLMSKCCVVICIKSCLGLRPCPHLFRSRTGL